jgi:hypothetical protein
MSADEEAPFTTQKVKGILISRCLQAPPGYEVRWRAAGKQSESAVRSAVNRNRGRKPLKGGTKSRMARWHPPSEAQHRRCIAAAQLLYSFFQRRVLAGAMWVRQNSPTRETAPCQTEGENEEGKKKLFASPGIFNLASARCPEPPGVALRFSVLYNLAPCLATPAT